LKIVSTAQSLKKNFSSATVFRMAFEGIPKEMTAVQIVEVP
jgi:hypothetical protein